MVPRRLTCQQSDSNNKVKKLLGAFPCHRLRNASPGKFFMGSWQPVPNVVTRMQDEKQEACVQSPQ